jgi:uncharacterized protein
MVGRRFLLADISPQAWKNGAGVTREIYVERDATSPGEFRFRLSRAEINTGAGFSHFPGVRRWLWLADGSAIELRINDELKQLDHIGDGVIFHGEDQVYAVPLDGISHDFNLMIADPKLDATTVVRPMVGSMVLHQPANTWLIFHQLQGQSRQQSESSTLAPGDTLIFEPQDRDQLVARLEGHGLILVINIT